MAGAAGANVLRRLAGIDGVEVSPSAFGEADAIWCNGKEIAHVDASGALDVRLTRAVIRELRPSLRADERVTLRPGTSDWIETRIESDADVDFAVELVERAAAAHRAAAGEVSKPPPTGSELARRRRFH